jgi:hypothetical protein
MSPTTPHFSQGFSAVERTVVFVSLSSCLTDWGPGFFVVRTVWAVCANCNGANAARRTLFDQLKPALPPRCINQAVTSRVESHNYGVQAPSKLRRSLKDSPSFSMLTQSKCWHVSWTLQYLRFCLHVNNTRWPTACTIDKTRLA